MRRLGLALALLAGGATPLRAHDMWIAPSSFAPAVGELVRVGLHVGHGAGDPVARDPLRTVRFTAVAGDDESAILGLDGRAPAGFVRPAAGLLTLLYTSQPEFLELSGARFNAYLEEEGLDAALAERRRLGLLETPGRELFARSLKSLLLVGGEGSLEGDRAHGLPLELVIERATPGELGMRLLYRGEPLAGVLIEARRLEAEATDSSRRSDDDGRARFALGTGAWLLTAVHIFSSSAERAEWESLWTSLSLALE